LKRGKRSQRKDSQVEIAEPRRNLLVKVWMIDVDRLLRGSTILQFLSNLGVLMYSKDLLLSVGSRTFSSVRLGALLWASANVTWLVWVYLSRRKWIREASRKRIPVVQS
jgi:hypothetical protein